MQLNSEITITADDFKRLAKQGLVLSRGEATFYYDPKSHLPTFDTRAIPGYLVREVGVIEPIKGYWDYFDAGRKFKVVQLPLLRYSKTKALDS